MPRVLVFFNQFISKQNVRGLVDLFLVGLDGLVRGFVITKIKLK